MMVSTRGGLTPSRSLKMHIRVRKARSPRSVLQVKAQNASARFQIQTDA
jgi:hypothetical protein